LISSSLLSLDNILVGIEKSNPDWTGR